MIISMLIRNWVKNHTEVAATFDVLSDNTLVVTIWNPEKTRILKKLSFTAEQLTTVIARNMSLIEVHL